MLTNTPHPHINVLYEHFIHSNGVCTDSRSLQKNQIFFALKGQNFNGNAFAKQALEQGARLAVVDEEQYATDAQCLLVEDVLLALQHLARHHRQQSRIPFLAITGSNGKTTTKELVALVLQKRYKVHATKGNLNNHIGVPLTLLSMPPQTQVAIIEMGANKQGDIAELCSIAEPTHGLITNIGDAHLEGFGGRAGVLKGKTELYRYLQQHKGTILLNSLEPTLGPMALEFGKPVLYGQKGNFCYASLIEATPFVLYEDENGDSVQTNLLGSYNFHNLLTALAVGKLFDIDSALANAAIAGYTPDNNRSQVLQTAKNTLIMDAYNANPTSMAAALASFEQLIHQNKKIILGDMLELGQESPLKHQQIADLAMNIPNAEVFFVGKLFHETLGNNYQVFESISAMRNFLEAQNLKDNMILLKGSRGIGLEKLIDLL
ncbi:MAG: UDP-N-acetylmuramoyl-tripeptide--D-alanyl-D-alanine ligase [Cytophagales bacterium]|nr:MAG: UDP-N-acetylmuramoyl-tripeptide--D-alanyl-D-alanine ligase [Cytophagales bacterium]TAF60561.1 MAG: UDP-N-acetylmuramoyl-tripeptide--D-alanyl-D-alanine ligase [Cytophagales bacterium]